MLKNLQKRIIILVLFIGLAYFINKYSGNLKSHLKYTTPSKDFKINSNEKIIWVEEYGLGILDRVKSYNEVIHRLKQTLVASMEANITVPNTTLDNQSLNFLQKITKFKNVRAIALAWAPNSTEEPWSSFNDKSNVLIKKYYQSSMDPLFCEAMLYGKKSSFRYELYYNQTLNCGLPDRSEARSLRLPTFYHNSFAEVFKVPPDYYAQPEALTYLLIFKNGISSSTGNIYTSDVHFETHACHLFDNSTKNWVNLPYFNHVFVISQDCGEMIYHRNIEVIPRLAPLLEFLKKNPDIRILVPNSADEVIKKMFDVFGLDPRRIVSGWVKAGFIYLPRPSPCVTAAVTETQITAREYKKYMEARPNIKKSKRNALVFIKRSYRKFVAEDSVVEALRNFADQFHFSFEIFPDKPPPSVDDTMRIFSSAKVVVAPHGAGLSNIIFSQPGTLVVEGLYEMWHANLCFERLSHVLGMRYYGALSSGGGGRAEIRVPAEYIVKILRHYVNKGFV